MENQANRYRMVSSFFKTPDMKLWILTLTITFAALFLGACKHRNKKMHCEATKNPVAYPVAEPRGTFSTGYGYVK